MCGYIFRDVGVLKIDAEVEIFLNKKVKFSRKNKDRGVNRWVIDFIYL
jgi:hypothetical protein